MPYITQNNRDAIDPALNRVAQVTTNGGELNYVISTIVATYVRKNGLRYQNISDVLGALNGAIGEFNRRVVDPYEQQKMLENGDLRAYDTLTEELNILEKINEITS